MTAPDEPALVAVDAPDDAAKPGYILRLYITGQTMRSTLALQNIRRICDEVLVGRCRLEVIDIYQEPKLASEAQIVAAPTLIKISPEPIRRIIGDLSDTEKVLSALDLRPRGAAYGT